QFTGPIPPELGNLTNLIDLWLDNNQLSGPIPSELGNLSPLIVLSLDNNQLVGTIPTDLGDLGSLYDLKLQNNPLTGSIPMSFMKLKLHNFHFENTSICEPADPDFGIWKATVVDWIGTNLTCINCYLPLIAR
ncbi:MAG TPA: hypothetical protein VN364_08045, partial [Bellilinea sp.]|nr:hypothetical protein [Bellilinea sp.]